MTDTHIAALAIAYHAEVYTPGLDFGRFPGSAVEEPSSPLIRH